MKTLALTLLVALALPALAQSPAAPVPADVRPGRVNGATAQALVAAGARVVDVRTPEEFASGHVPGAINIPYEEIGKRTSEIGPTSTSVIVYCASGYRSGIAAGTLEKAGYKNLYDLRSVTAWPGPLAK